MAVVPKTVGELRRFLETYDDNLEVMVQGATDENPNATPNHFVVEFWGPEDTDNQPFLLLAGIPYNSVPLKNVNDPNASFNLPK